jgi:serine/threonine protein kinase
MPAQQISDVVSIQWSSLKIDQRNPNTKGLLGRGSSSVVMQGLYTNNQHSRCQRVAIKILAPRSIITHRDFAALSKEAKKEAVILAKSIDDHVVKIIGVASGAVGNDVATASALKEYRIHPDDNKLGIVMELLDGGSLNELINPPTGMIKEKLDMQEKIRILKEIATGLWDIHSMGIVHGDIKPQNIMLTSRDRKIKLIDFGLSHTTAIDRGEGLSTVQETTTMKGTPLYMAPEMIDQSGGKVVKASRSTDMYAFAILAHYLLSGKLPHEGKGDFELKKSVVDGKRPYLHDLPRSTPQDIESMIKDCWHPQKEKRRSAQYCSEKLTEIFNRFSEGKYDIFLSHAWVDKPIVQYIHRYLCRFGYRIWIDVEDMGWDLEYSMTQGIENAHYTLACLSSIYQSRENCMFELRKAQQQGKPIIAVFIEDDYFNKAHDEVKTICDFKNKLFCDGLGTIAGDQGWKSNDGPSRDLVCKLEKDMPELVRIIQSAGCPRSFQSSNDVAISSSNGINAQQMIPYQSRSSITTSPTKSKYSDVINDAKISEDEKKQMEDMVSSIQMYFVLCLESDHPLTLKLTLTLLYSVFYYPCHCELYNRWIL